MKISKQQLPSLLIRLGLAIVFAYAAISAFRTPEAWLGFVPPFTNKFIDPKLALDLLSLAQLFVVAWLVSGYYVKYAAIVSGLFLGGILFTSPDAFLITFRDIGLVFACAALYFLDDSKKTIPRLRR